MSDKISAMIMDTGEKYNDGEGITIGTFWALDFVKHYGRVQTGANISIAMHSYLAAMIADSWYTYQKNTGYKWPISQAEFSRLVFYHDCAEAYVGDVWQPAKTPEFKELENRVHEKIMDFITVPMIETDELHIERKKVDNCAQFVELVRYLEISPDHKVFTEIALQMARTIVSNKMDDFCLKTLKLEKHEVAVNLLRATINMLAERGER